MAYARCSSLFFDALVILNLTTHLPFAPWTPLESVSRQSTRKDLTLLRRCLSVPRTVRLVSFQSPVEKGTESMSLRGAERRANLFLHALRLLPPLGSGVAMTSLEKTPPPETEWLLRLLIPRFTVLFDCGMRRLSGFT